MNKIILISLLFFTTLFSKQLEVYKLTENSQQKIATINVAKELSIILPSVLSNKSTMLVSLMSDDYKDTYIYDLTGNLILQDAAGKFENICINLGDDQNLYKWMQRSVNGKSEYTISKKDFFNSKWNQIAHSPDNYISLT